MDDSTCSVCSVAIDEKLSQNFGGLCENCARNKVQIDRGYLSKHDTAFRRICAHFVDGLLVTFILALAKPISRMDISESVIFVSEALVLTLLMFYPAIMHAWRGQTIGKMVVRIKVLTLDEQRCISFPRSILREIAPILVLPISIYLLYHSIYFPSEGISEQSLLLTQLVKIVISCWYVLEIGSMLLNSKRRAIHDYLAGSVVVNLDLKEGA